MLLNIFNTGFLNSNTTVTTMGGNTKSSSVELSDLNCVKPNCHFGGYDGGAFHVVIGAGNTAPTVNDYDLADSSIMAADKMAPLYRSSTYDASTGATVSVQWRNESSEAITVKEVGLAYKIDYQNQYNKAANLLAARKVLNTPVTIQPGETYVFSYNIRV